MNIRTRFAIAGAVISTIVALTVGGLLVRQSTMSLEQNARGDLMTQLAAVAPVIASAPTTAQLITTLSANSTTNGVRVVRNGVESRVGSMPLHPPALSVGSIVTIHSDGQSWYAASTMVPVASSIASSPVEVDLFYPRKGLNSRLGVIRRRVRMVLGASVLASIVLSWIVGTYVSAPLRRLSKSVGARGSSPGEGVPEDQGVEEVDELGRTINGLVDQLQAEHTQTVAALDAARSFSFNAVHELRTPLTSMQTDLDVLRAHPDLDMSERAQLLEGIAAQQERLNANLRALHDLARGEFQAHQSMVEVDLAEIAEQAVDAARAFNPSTRINLETPDHVMIKGWPEGLRLALDNLITNALRHGADPGGQSVIVVQLKASSSIVELVVQDNGPGIDENEQAHIFERFGRGKTAAPGTGLGLALVTQQAELHGGEIRIEATYPHGARFVWNLLIR